MDAEEYTTAEELLALAADKKGWAARVRHIDPVDHNIAATMVTSSLDASVEEWKKGAKIHHGSGMRCGLGNLFVISELNSAIIFFRLKNMIVLFSSQMTNRFPSPHLIPRP